MSNESHRSSVEISLGNNEIRISGSEEFISGELESILEKIDLTKDSESLGSTKQTLEGDSEEETTIEQANLKGRTIEGTENLESEKDPLNVVADDLNVDVTSLKRHFYVEEVENGEEYDVHIQDPTGLPNKFAFLGFCTIREVLNDQIYHENVEMKRRLIDVEKIDINNWGGTFLYRLRNDGLIKDDPNTNKKRNKPFKITPSGRQDLIDWLKSQ